MKRQIPDRRSELCVGASMVPRNVTQQFKTAVAALLRKISRMTEIGIICHENRRDGSIGIAQSCPRLLQITGREAQLMNDRRRYNARVVQPERLCLKRVMNAEEREIS